jgi:hypothetical protein
LLQGADQLIALLLLHTIRSTIIATPTSTAAKATITPWRHSFAESIEENVMP